jgi:hypothetical protein
VGAFFFKRVFLTAWRKQRRIIEIRLPVRFSRWATELNLPFMRFYHAPRELNFQQVPSPGKTEQRRNVFTQQPASFLGDARQDGLLQFM